VAEFAAALGTPLMPWQQHVADVALEVDNATGRLKYRRVILTVPRQSGKTTLLLALFAHRALGFGGPQVMSYAAQTGVDARKKFIDEHVPMLERSLLSQLFHVRKTNGHEAVLWQNGSRHHISAGTEKSGHGSTLDLAVVDEAFAQPDGRLEQAFSPAQITRPEPQLWFVSTAGTPQHTFFRDKVKAGRLAVDSGAIAYFEWSAPQDAPAGDREVWRECMPALGHTINEATIAAEFLSMPEDEFRRAYLNQWVDERAADTAIDLSLWARQADPAAVQGAAPRYAVATAPDRSWSAIGAAWYRPDGGVQVSVVDYRRDTTWVAARLKALGARPAEVLTDTASRGLVEGTQEPSQADQGRAHNAFTDALLAGSTWHDDQGELTTAVRGAHWRPLGDGRVIDRKGTAEISPLIAVMLAAHGLTNPTAARPGRFMSF